jgi:hypothetical protein
MSQLYPCPHNGCSKVLKNKSGLTQHRHAKHGYSLPPQQSSAPFPPLSPGLLSQSPYFSRASFLNFFWWEDNTLVNEGMDVDHDPLSPQRAPSPLLPPFSPSLPSKSPFFACLGTLTFFFNGEDDALIDDEMDVDREDREETDVNAAGGESIKDYHAELDGQSPLFPLFISLTFFSILRPTV